MKQFAKDQATKLLTDKDHRNAVLGAANETIGLFSKIFGRAKSENASVNTDISVNNLIAALPTRDEFAAAFAVSEAASIARSRLAVGLAAASCALSLAVLIVLIVR